MKATLGSDFPDPAAVTDNTMLSLQPGSSGVVAIGQKPVNNRNSKSPKFRRLDNSITYMDAEYDDLPQSGPNPGPNKDSWEALVPTFATIQLCGCYHGGMNGKQLHRSVNLFRQITGQTYTDTPPADPTWTPFSIEFIFQEHSPVYPINALVLTTANAPEDIYIVWQQNKGLENPITYVPQSINNFTMPNTDPMWPILFALPNKAAVKYCLFTLPGYPLNQDSLMGIVSLP
jgi:hypothetical protein